MKILMTISLLTAALCTKVLAAPMNEDEPGYVNPAEEIQLNKLGPSVKTINLEMQGTERVVNEMNSVRDIMLNIINNYEVAPMTMPIPNGLEPVSIADIATRVELKVRVEYPENDYALHRITIQLEELGTDPASTQERLIQSETSFFDYNPANPSAFADAVRTYLIKRLNLKPKQSVQ